MVKHFIIMSSSYSEGRRIAMHYVVDESMSPEMLSSEVKKIKNHCGETVAISTHFVETGSNSWESVIKTDCFFENVQVVDSLVGFVNLISADRVLNGLDIAKYILANRVCTHLELEKLVYMCYAEYLCATKHKLFEDTIYAFKYGPVVKSVYDEYKGTKNIDETFSKDHHLAKEYAVMPARSRILFAEDGVSKICSIDATLKKCCKLSVSDLVRITHAPDGPWDSVDNKDRYCEIPDDVILDKHCKEEALI